MKLVKISETYIDKDIDYMDFAIEYLQDNNSVLIAHYYTDKVLQNIAERTGGIVADSLDMAKFAYSHSAETIFVAGVYFMAETVKILNPNKTVYLLDNDAACSLVNSCLTQDFLTFTSKYPDRVVVSYINTSAEVKAISDWVVTSRIAVDLIEYLDDCNKKIIWAPDKNMRHYLKKKTGADILLWDGTCVVHDSLKAESLKTMQKMYPQAITLCHPESPITVVEISDVVGSTKELIDASIHSEASTFIVATDRAILHQMESLSPHKQFIEAPSKGVGATCISCAHCPWMELNSLEKLYHAIQGETEEIFVDEAIRIKALEPLNKMIHFNLQNLCIS